MRVNHVHIHVYQCIHSAVQSETETESETDKGKSVYRSVVGGEHLQLVFSFTMIELAASLHIDTAVL
jgi:hypothetical protein